MSAPNPTVDYYEALEVSSSASPEVIKAAYDGLMKKYGDDPNPAVRERRRFVEAAYDVIGNAARRAEYDIARRGVVVTPSPAVTDIPRATIAECPRDPGVETALKCSRCETPICPRCLVQTPVGARCKDCARIARSPVYTVTGTALWRAIGAAVGGGIAMGLIWGFASVTVRGVAYGGIFISLILGVGLGYGLTRIVEAATGRKRGPRIVACAIGGLVLALIIQSAFVGTIFVGSIIAVGVGVYFVYQNLR